MFDPIRNPSDTLALEQGCYFDEAAGLRPIKFIETFCRQSQGRQWKGKPLLLLDWQKDFLMRLFGWMNEDGNRRFRRAYLEVAKKNGKTTMLSALVLYLLLGDREGTPEIYLNAVDKEQAGMIFEEAARMVKASPGLSSKLSVVDYRKRILHPAENGKIITNAGEVESLDGRNPSAVIFDELHRLRHDRRPWEVFRYAGAAREQPLTISLTTAGEDTQGIWYEQREYSEKVNSGSIPDTTHLGVIYRALPEDDIDDPGVWRKANPSLGVTLREDVFSNDLKEARTVPVNLATFKRLRLCIVAAGEGKFLDINDWDACPSEVLDPEDYIGQPCHMGLDLSSKNDLTALATVFEGPGDTLDIFLKFWLPKDNIVALSEKDGQNYLYFAERGDIELTPGVEIDMDAVRNEVVRQAALYDLRAIGIDPWQATQLAIKLREEDGIEAKFVRQGAFSLNEPTKELRSLVLARRLRHQGNPLLRWNAENAVEVVDVNKNIHLHKGLLRKKIDGIAALVNAIRCRIDDPYTGDSVYESRGLLRL